MDLIAKLEQEEIERVLAGKSIPEFAPGDTVFVNAVADGRVELSLEPEAAAVN